MTTLLMQFLCPGHRMASAYPALHGLAVPIVCRTFGTDESPALIVHAPGGAQAAPPSLDQTQPASHAYSEHDKMSSSLIVWL